MLSFNQFLKENIGYGLGSLIKSYKMAHPKVIKIIPDNNGNFRNHKGEIVDQFAKPTGEVDGEEEYWQRKHQESPEVEVETSSPLWGKNKFSSRRN